MRDPPPFTVPSAKVPQDIPRDVILDVAFLAFNIDKFALCQSLKVIEDDIKTGKPWMIQWVGMLGSWKARAETMWEDVTTTPSSKTARCECLDWSGGVNLTDYQRLLSRTRRMRCRRAVRVCAL